VNLEASAKAHPVLEFCSAPLNAIGVMGTPTLLLVDAKGTVAQVWEGKLQADQEGRVLALLKTSGSL